MTPMVRDNMATPSTEGSRSRVDALQLGVSRKIWTSTHRWIGLVAGAYFVVAGLTGSVLAFWQDLDEWLNPNLMIVSEPTPNSPYRSVDEIVAAARTQLPDAVKARPDTPIYVRFPNHRTGAVQVTYMTGLPSREQMEEARRTRDHSKFDMALVAGHTIFVDPYTARVTGSIGGWSTRPLSMPFVYMMMSLHCALLWEPYGRLVVAGVGLLLLISTIVGICLWLPRNGAWSKALKIKLGAKLECLVYDLHKAFVELASESANGRPPLAPSEAVAIAEKHFPDGWLQMLVLPRGENGTYAIGKHLDGEPNQASASRMLVMDQYSGKILATQDPRDFSAGEKFFEWQYPLHSGEAFDNAGRAFMLAFGFVPLVLYVTGFIRWRHKARNQSSRRRKSVDAS